MAILKKRFFILIGIILFLMTSFLFTSIYQTQNSSNVVVIGSKNCTENQIVAEIIATLIEKNTDIKVKRKFNLEGTLICFEALRSKDIDMYPEYTGTAMYAILKDHRKLDNQKMLCYLKNVFDKRFEIQWLEPFGFENAYVLLMDSKKTKELKIFSISDLSNHIKKNKMQIAFDPEFSVREEVASINRNYDLDVNYKLMDQSLMYFSLANGVIDLANGFATDSRIKKYDLTILKDDKKAMPSYIAAPIVRKEVLQKYPNLTHELKKLEGIITDEKIKKLNYLADEKKQKVYDIAYTFLKSEKLI